MTFWRKNGQKYREEKYQNGKIVNTISWDKDGNDESMNDQLSTENKGHNTNYYFNDSDIPWLDQQALTDDEKLAGEAFWRGIL